MTPIAPPSDFYVTGGTLPRDAPSYTARKADEDLLEGLHKGQFCYVLTSRQMGKSSLMVRTVTRLRQENVTCLVIDLTATGQNLSEDQWYDGLLNCVATDLGLEDELDDFWQDNKRLGPLQRWMHALRSIVLTHVTGQVVIFVDEVDAVRSVPFSADEFFAGVRECYNRRTEDPEFNRLTFCLLGVATPADLIRDTRSTPFNIGKRIALSDFTDAEAAPLAEGLVAQREGESGKQGEGEKRLLNRVLYWTHGHPYLTQRLCSAVSESPSVRIPNTEYPIPNSQRATPDLVDRICNEIFLSPGAQATDDNLLFVRERLLRADCDPTSLLMLYDKVRSGKRVQNSETDYQLSILKLSGIVRVENGVLCVRNRIYAHVFDRTWVRRSIPDEDLKRQKSAFRKGVLGAALALGSLLLLAIGAFMLTHYQKHLDMQVPLPDGTELIVNDVSFGKDKTYETGAFRWRELFGWSSSDKVTFRDPCLSVWLSIYNPKTRKTEALNSGSTVIAVDEHGDLFSNTYMGGEMADNNRVVRFDFSNFPRRGRTIHIRLQRAYAVGDPKLSLNMPATEFDIPNPVPNLYPLWTPDSLPASKTAGDLTVRLNSVRWGYPIGGPNDPWHSHQLLTDYSCREGEQPGWPKHNPCQIEWMELSDATGNRTDGWAAFTGGMSIYEPAWRLRLSLVRSADASFTSSQTWTLKGAMMPKDGCVVLPKGIGKVGGVTITSISIAAAPRVTYSDGVPPSTSGTLGKTWGHGSSAEVKYSKIPRQAAVVSGCRPQIAVTVSGMKEDQRLTVWATDAGGRRYNEVGQRMLNWNSNQQSPPVQVQLLAIPQAVRGVDLHFSVQDIKTVEFMVRPPLPGRL